MGVELASMHHQKFNNMGARAVWFLQKLFFGIY